MKPKPTLGAAVFWTVTMIALAVVAFIGLAAATGFFTAVAWNVFRALS